MVDILNENEDIGFYPNGEETKAAYKDFIDATYNILYSRRAYVHWFIGEGLDEAICK